MQLEGHTVATLKDFCEAKNISTYRLRKPEICDVIYKHFKVPM